MNLKVTLFLTLLFAWSSVNAQTSISKLNLSHQYLNDKEYDARLYGLRHIDNVVLMAAFKLPDTTSTLTIGFWGAQNYNDPVIRIDSLLQKEFYLGKEGDYHYYEYHLKTTFPLVALELVTGEKTAQVYDVLFTDQKLNISIFDNNDLPVMDRWLNENTTYYLKDLMTETEKLTVTLFNHNFRPASSPMSGKNVEEKELQIDSTFTIEEEIPFFLNEEGFYLFQKDTTSTIGYGWLMKKEAFPNFNTLEKLIPPLIYITSQSEYGQLSRERDKKTFDKFWLKLGGSQQIAKSMISRYYNRVEAANKYFTSYKEGWKTDRGMIYIVYGPPSRVLRDDNGETWFYGTGNSAETFKFTRFSHVFYPYNYVLLRNEKYRRSWYSAVDYLRNYYN